MSVYSGQPLDLLRIVTTDAKLVSFRVSKVRPIKIRVVFGSQARSAFACSIQCQRQGMGVAYDLSIRCQQSNHLPISWRRRFAVERFAHYEKRACSAGVFPGRPWAFKVCELEVKSEYLHDPLIKHKCSIEVIHSDEYM